jgi:peroxiredoxin family protein
MSKKINLLVFGGDYDKALAAFVIANGAREMELDVSMFFAFWGLLIVRAPDRFSVANKGLLEKVFSLITPKGPEGLTLSKLNMFGIGQRMLKVMMKNKNKPMLEDFIEGARKKKVKFYGCKLSMEVMGFKKEDMIPELEIIDVNQYLKDALESDVQLFV